MRRAASTSFVKARRLAARTLILGLIAVTGPVAALGASFHWVFDLASQFRVQYCWGLLIAAAALSVLEQWILAGVAGALLVCHAAVVLPLYAPVARSQAGVEAIRILSLNVRRSNDHYARIVTFVRELRPDIALFLEVDDDWELALACLGDLYPHSHVEARLDSRGIAIFSRLPLERTELIRLDDDVPAIRTSIQTRTSTLHLFGIHPYPPINGRMSDLRDRQMDSLARAVIETAGERIVIGDFNMTSWTPAFSKFVTRTGLRDTRRGRGVQSTWPAPLLAFLRIPIDHCLVSPGIDVLSRRVGPNVGSDHLPIVVEIALKSTDSNPRT